MPCGADAIPTKKRFAFVLLRVERNPVRTLEDTVTWCWRDTAPDKGITSECEEGAIRRVLGGQNNLPSLNLVLPNEDLDADDSDEFPIDEIPNVNASFHKSQDTQDGAPHTFLGGALPLVNFDDRNQGKEYTGHNLSKWLFWTLFGQ